jgi:hypothetical protein
MGEMTLVPPTGLNDRISPEYLELQRQFHESAPRYGTNSVQYLDTIKTLIKEMNIASVLDYGCGKGELKKALGEIVQEYDPAIPGKDGEPKPVQLVICTDVLEHIEPSKLDSVLEHIRCLGEWIFFIVSTVPATKDLPDGRNAHILLRDAEWWRKTLETRFEIKRWTAEGEGIGCLVKPYVLIGEINGVGVMDYSERLEHIRKNVEVTTSRLKPHKFVYWTGNDMPMFGVRVGFDERGIPKWGIPNPHNRVAIVMCYGPSLQDTWKMALDEREFIDKSDIVSVSGAHDFLIDKGIIPKYHIECDPRLHKGDMMQKLHRRVEYYMASVCHPDLVKKLKDYKLTLWHMNEGDPSLQILDIEPNSVLVPGGGSVGLRSLALLYIMGYRRFLIHGMDCSYRDGETHAGKHTGKETQKVEVRCTDGRKFITAPVLITYKRYFDEIRRSFVGDADKDASKIEIILRGDGLLQHWLRVSGGAEGYQPVTEVAA